MKKFYSFITFGIIVLFSLSLTSCNDDNIAATLDGVWEGEVTQNYSWRWNNYSVYQYVEIEFITDPTGMLRVMATSMTTMLSDMRRFVLHLR